MTRHASTVIIAVCLIIGLAAPGAARAQNADIVDLPEPQKTIGKPLMQCLNDRHTERAFSPRELEPQQLSNLLWAAWGVNREDGRRTAPSASNNQEIEVYCAMADGLYLYDAPNHRLRKILDEDIRAQTGEQAFVADAPLNLVYVADFSEMGDGDYNSNMFTAGCDTGFISQNVYLYCASEGLATVVRGWFSREGLKMVMNLREDQHPILTQTVGYPE